MAQAKQATAKRSESTAQEQSPRCLPISDGGINTAQDFARFMSAMIGDVISGRISSSKAQAASQTGGKLLKVIEMQYRYGIEGTVKGKRVLRLID